MGCSVRWYSGFRPSCWFFACNCLGYFQLVFGVFAGHRSLHLIWVGSVRHLVCSQGQLNIVVIKSAGSRRRCWLWSTWWSHSSLFRRVSWPDYLSVFCFQFSAWTPQSTFTGPCTRFYRICLLSVLSMSATTRILQWKGQENSSEKA